MPAARRCLLAGGAGGQAARLWRGAGRSGLRCKQHYELEHGYQLGMCVWCHTTSTAQRPAIRPRGAVQEAATSGARMASTKYSLLPTTIDVVDDEWAQEVLPNDGVGAAGFETKLSLPAGVLAWSRGCLNVPPRQCPHQLLEGGL